VRPLFAVGRPVYRRALRPAWEAVAPQVRFLWGRVTPGELGLELTTALAVAGVGIFVYVLYLVELSSGDLGPLPLDVEAFDMVDRLRNDTLVDVAKVVTGLGALPTILALVGGTSIILAARRRWAELIVLVVGLGLVYVAVHVSKAAIDRPRPGDPLIETSLSAYPSGHAAYATAWIAVALVLTRRLGLLANTAVVTVGIAIAVGVGLSRVYLRAHYWSDVAGGWGLGCGIFAALASIGLVVEYFRQNGGRREPEPSLARAER
jgi:membrane-associated phospholipid phosphatase